MSHLSLRLFCVAALIINLESLGAAAFVGQERQPPQVITAIMPKYPIIAVAERASGVVIIDVKLNEEGKVVEAITASGHNLLVAAAKEAALKWIFNPTKKSGKPRSVRLTFIFHNPSYTPPQEAPEYVCPYIMEVFWSGTVDTFPTSPNQF